MKVISKALAFLVLIFAVLSCSSLGKLVEKQAERQLDKGMNVNKVNSMWGDVPKMDGLGESLNDELPLSINLIMRTFVNLVLNNADNKNENHKDVGVDFIFYHYQGTDTDIDKFYTAEKMKTAGNWNLPDGMKDPCLNAAEKGLPGEACLFQKIENGKQQGLIVVALPTKEKDAPAFVYFFRAETEPDATQPQ